MLRLPSIEINPRFEEALAALQQADRPHLFITGKADTGKSTLLSCFRNWTERDVVVLAPTGVAALKDTTKNRARLSRGLPSHHEKVSCRAISRKPASFGNPSFR